MTYKKMNLNVSLVFLVYFISANFGNLKFLQAADNYALLSATLRTFQAHACDNNELRLNCTQNTVISINYVHYGRKSDSDDLCPLENHEDSFYTKHQDFVKCNVSTKALKVIEERCRGQMLCRLHVKPETFRYDPCPNMRKYAEVAYKCRPVNFNNKIACEGQRLTLNCPFDRRIAIYSAVYGSTKPGVLECPQNEGTTDEDCQASYATEIVMSTCSGQKQCSIVADRQSFGILSCGSGQKKYLKVTYICVDQIILKPYPTGEQDIVKEDQIIHTTSYPAWAGVSDHSFRSTRGHAYGVSTISSSSFELNMQSDEVPTENNSKSLSSNQKLVAFISNWASGHKYMKDNKARFILYVSISLAVGLLIFLTILGARYLILRAGSRKNSKLDVTPVSEEGFFNESDLEHYEPSDSEANRLPPPPPVPNYTASLRRNSSDAQPRAPITTGSELNHYFS